jgi:hypothetical protein
MVFKNSKPVINSNFTSLSKTPLTASKRSKINFYFLSIFIVRFYAAKCLFLSSYQMHKSILILFQFFPFLFFFFVLKIRFEKTQTKQIIHLCTFSSFPLVYRSLNRYDFFLELNDQKNFRFHSNLIILLYHE